MKLQERINAFAQLGTFITSELNNPKANEKIQISIANAQQKNQWFTPSSIAFALKSIANSLTKTELSNWTVQYENELAKEHKPKKIGVIMAGNIPLVGFHDALCVLMSGNHLKAKLSKDDAVLLPYLFNELVRIEPSFIEQIEFVERLENPDAVIATGSNNSARYFDYYFGKYPHIIRKNRNSAAIITGDENEKDILKLGEDVFTYFGLGCRNVSKLYVPFGYDFGMFFRVLESFSEVMNHNKYMNNYDYNHAVYLLNLEPFVTNNFLILREHNQLATPASVINYEYYSNISELSSKIKIIENELQCLAVAGKPWDSIGIRTITFGTTQTPSLTEYADNVDTMKFLLSL